MEELKTPSTYEGFGLDVKGESDKNKVWRIYEANATPCLTYFMTPVEVDVPSSTTEVNYDCNEHTASISDILTAAKEQVAEPEHIFGHDVKGTEVGTYKSQVDGKENNTVYLIIKDGTTSTPEPKPTPILEMNYNIIHKKGYSFQKGFYEDLDANFHILQAKEDVSDSVR